MSTVRRVQYGVPGGADSGDPAAGASKPRVVVTEETDGTGDKFEKLLDGETTRTSEAETEARRRASARVSDMDRERRIESAEPLDDTALADKLPSDEDGPTPAERSREEAAAEEAQGASPGDAETLVENKQSEEADGLEEQSGKSETDDEPADATAGAGRATEGGVEGAVPSSTGTSGERHGAAPPVAASGHTGEHQRRHDGSSAFNDDDAAAAAAAAALQPPPAALAGMSMEPPTIDKVADTAPQAISEIAQQVAAQLSVRQAAPGAPAQVRIHLRDDVMPKTSLMVTTDGDAVQVTVTTGSAESAALVEANASDLAAAIAGSTGKATRVRYRDHSGAACEVEAEKPAATDQDMAAP